jgi:mitogen-activated protein kinase 1/3
MDKMLQFHPGKRIDVAAALKHPWLAQLHDETQEPAAPGVEGAGRLVLLA